MAQNGYEPMPDARLSFADSSHGPGPVLLFDVFSLLYRAFFALPPMTTVSGEPTSALYGFSALVLKMLREERARGAAFALDRPGQTFRRAAFAGYKASRQAAPTPLAQQVARVPQLLDAFGFPSFALTGYEADDVLATLASELRAAGEAPLVVTGDLDLLQCAIEPARVHAVGRGTQGRTYDQAAVWARYGVAPGELPDWKALVGDVTDDIPGVPGVGPRTATALVRQFGSVSGLLARLAEVASLPLRAAIAGLGTDLPLWRELTRLHEDVPLPRGPRWAALTAQARHRLQELFAAAGVPHVAASIGGVAGGGPMKLCLPVPAAFARILALVSALVSALVLGPMSRPAAGHPEDHRAGAVVTAVNVGDRDLRIEFDRHLHSRLVARLGGVEIPLGGFRPTELLVVGGREVTDFTLSESRRSPVQDRIGKGLQVQLRGDGPGLEKQLTITLYDDFPELAVVQSRYTVRGKAPVRVDRWVHRRYVPARTGSGKAGAGPAFWSYQSGSYARRPDWVLPLRPGFSQRNFMGMNATDYGGGTPISDVWRGDVGVAVGHIETTPRLVSLPVRLPGGGGGPAIVAIEQEVQRILMPGETLSSVRSFVSVHRGDHFATLTAYRRLMDRQGLRPPAFPESAYEPIWCGWGYGRQVTAAQIVGTLPTAAALGFKWAVLDDGWQTAEGDWALDPRKFPGGDADMRKLTDAIRAAGMKPMLWWAPLAADPGTQLLAHHPEYLLHEPGGKPRAISWWDAQYLCPASPAVQDYTRGLVKRFLGDWGFQGLKLDGQHLNAAPPCHNPAHRHSHPDESFERVPELFRSIHETAAKVRPGAVLELCPCGTGYAFHSMPYLHLPVASDPESSWQVRHKGKTLKALMGPSAPYFGDHVELSDGGSDFASTVGVGGVVGTQFTLPELGRSERKYHLTPARMEAFRKWVALYSARMLPKGQYLGDLYDIGFDRPETHAIAREGRLYYAFFAPRFRGKVQLRGLGTGRFCLRDYERDRAYPSVQGPVAELAVTFERHLLLEAIPGQPGTTVCPER